MASHLGYRLDCGQTMELICAFNEVPSELAWKAVLSSFTSLSRSGSPLCERLHLQHPAGKTHAFRRLRLHGLPASGDYDRNPAFACLDLVETNHVKLYVSPAILAEVQGINSKFEAIKTEDASSKTDEIRNKTDGSAEAFGL